MSVPTLDGIYPQSVSTRRLTTRVLFSGPDDGIPVLFVHGNVSSATFWEETMLALSDGFRGIAPDLRGFGEADPAQKIDATRGMGELSDDLVALLDHLGIERAHVVGHSLGGGAVWHLMMDAPDRILTVTQAAPGSPYGFGSTRDVNGTPAYDDFAGSGAGLTNPELIRLITESDRSADNQFSPLNVLNASYFKPPFKAAREDAFVESMLTLHLGEQDYPGDSVPSNNWPGTAPGVWGPNNATSPKYADDPARLFAIDPKPPVLWIRGADDLIVSDTSMADAGTLGAMGLIPGWPGAEVFPSQPMIGQIRAVLEQYGAFEEVVFEDCGHSPYIEKPDEFSRVFHAHIGAI